MNKIKLNLEKMDILSEVCEFASRFICGQIEYEYWPYCLKEDISDKHYKDENISMINNYMKSIQSIWWGEAKGHGFNTSSDNLFKIHKTISHFMYKKTGGNNPAHIDNYPPSSLYQEIPEIKETDDGYIIELKNQDIFLILDACDFVVNFVMGNIYFRFWMQELFFIHPKDGLYEIKVNIINNCLENVRNLWWDKYKIRLIQNTKNYINSILELKNHLIAFF